MRTPKYLGQTLALTAVSLLALSAAAPAMAKPAKALTQADIHDMIMAEAQKLVAIQKADDDASDTQKQAQIDALQAEVRGLADQLHSLQTQSQAQAQTLTQTLAVVAAPKPVAAAPVANVTLKNGSPTIASSDGAFTFNVKGLFQADAATYSQDDDLPTAVSARDLNSGTNIRRARIIFNGKMFTDFDYNLTFDFGGAGAEDVGRVHEAWVQYSGFKSAKFRVGEFGPNVGLADAGSQAGSPFLERASSAEIARNFAGGDTRMGIAAFNAKDRYLWSVAVTGNTVSSLNTAASGFNVVNNDEQLGVTARIAGTPIKTKNALIHVGLNYSGIINPADTGAAASTRYPVQLRDRPELRVDGTRLVDTGVINANSAAATGVELGAQYKNLFLQSEAFDYRIERLNAATGVTNPKFTGWYVEGGWVLTGESRKYNTATAAFDGVTPAANFDPKSGHWGAFELVARYSTLDLNYHDTSTLTADRVLGGQQDITALALDWQLTPTVRFIFQGQSVTVDRLNAAGDQIGQDYTTFAVRSQFGF
jgi:phosphate-selective porin OprO/OprP